MFFISNSKYLLNKLMKQFLGLEMGVGLAAAETGLYMKINLTLYIQCNFFGESGFG